jgi:DNA-binding transcriptional LysR family regulator
MAMKRLYDRLDTRLFPAFMAAAESLNFTEAAKAAAMTQSGISQHIARLEEQIGLPLFQRGGGKISLTPTGVLLQQFVQDYVVQMEGFFAGATTQQEELNGMVTYAMPESCLFANHFETLLQDQKKNFPRIHLQVQIAGNEAIYDLLRNNQIDFAFVTEQFDTKAFEFLKFCDEEYALIGNENFFSGIDAGAVRDLPMIKWKGMRDSYEIWRNKAFPGKQTPAFGSLRTVGYVDSLFGVVTMLKAGAGVTILPYHCCQELIEKNELQVFRSSKPSELSHSVYIARLANHSHMAKVQCVIDSFMKTV